MNTKDFFDEGFSYNSTAAESGAISPFTWMRSINAEAAAIYAKHLQFWFPWHYDDALKFYSLADAKEFNEFLRKVYCCYVNHTIDERMDDLIVELGSWGYAFHQDITEPLQFWDLCGGTSEPLYLFFENQLNEAVKIYEQLIKDIESKRLSSELPSGEVDSTENRLLSVIDLAKWFAERKQYDIAERFDGDSSKIIEATHRLNGSTPSVKMIERKNTRGALATQGHNAYSRAFRTLAEVVMGKPNFTAGELKKYVEKIDKLSSDGEVIGKHSFTTEKTINKYLKER